MYDAYWKKSFEAGLARGILLLELLAALEFHLPLVPYMSGYLSGLMEFLEKRFAPENNQ